MRSTGRPARDLLLCAAIAFLTLAAYSPVAGYGFVNYDDPAYVVENPHVRAGVSVSGIVWAFTTFHKANWHPITWISHMVACQLFGLDPGPHHLMNLMFHIAAAILLFLALSRMTGAAWRSAMVSGLFALHPAHVESVAWISERKDVLSAALMLLALLAWSRYLAAPRASRYMMALFVFALGLMAKAMLVTFPFLLLLLDVWPLGRVSWRGRPAPVGASRAGARDPNPRVPSPRKPRRLERASREALGSGSSPEPADGRERARRVPRPGELLLEKVPFLALSLASCVLTYLAQSGYGAVVPGAMLPLAARAGNALVSVLRYVGKLLWPSALAVFYPHPGTWPAEILAGAAVVLLAVTVSVVLLLRRAPYLAVGWFWFLGTLVPVLGLVQVGGQSMADRYTYLPSVGLFVALVWGAAGVAASWRLERWLAVVSAVILVPALTVACRVQVGYWRSSITLFTRAVQVTRGNAFAHDVLAASLDQSGRAAEAMASYEEAIRIDPNDVTAHNGLGTLLAAEGRYQEAIASYGRALRVDPRHAEANNNMGAALASLGRPRDAIEHYRVALEQRADYADARYNLAGALLSTADTAGAAQQYREALRLDPSRAPAHYGLALSYLRQGLHDEAIGEFLETLRIDPSYRAAEQGLERARAGKAARP